MSTKAILSIVAAVVFAIFAILGVVAFTTYVKYDTQEVQLRNLIKAKQENNKVIYDNTWKTIQQVAGVSESYKDGFQEIYAKIMDARYSKGDGSLMKWVTEANPSFDIRLYEKLANTIEAKRQEFTENQTQLLDLKRTHDNVLDTWPGRWILSGRQKIDVQLVTSTRTENSFATGKDDDVSLPGQKK